MARLINGTLLVPAYTPTANPGEYTFTGATYANAADATGNGAADLNNTFLLFVPAADPNTFEPVPGVMHRYKFTALNVVNQNTIGGTILWDEGGLEVDKPLDGARAIISEKGAGLGLGYPVSTAVYPNLPGGADLAAIVVEERVKLNAPPVGGDLSGSLPNPTVAKINGVALSGVPSSGQVLTATGAAAASWQTPAGGGGSVTGTGTAGKLSKWTSGTAIADSVLSENAGEVGLGMVPAGGSDGFSVKSVGPGGRGFTLWHSTTAVRIAYLSDANSGTGGRLTLSDNGATAFCNIEKDSAYYVGTAFGIGTGAPTAGVKLHVVGTFKLADGSQQAARVLTSDAAGLASWAAPASASALKTTGADVTVSSAAPPTTGQVLTATGATAASWQTPAGGSSYAATQVVAAPTGTAATDTAAIQAALTAATSTGGTVMLREGSYQINATLTIPAKVRLVGQGKDATTILAASGFTGASMIVSTGDYGGLAFLTVDGNHGVRGYLSGNLDINIGGDSEGAPTSIAGHWSINNVRFTNMASNSGGGGSATIRFGDASNASDPGSTGRKPIVIEGCEFILNGNETTASFMRSYNCLFEGCTFFWSKQFSGNFVQAETCLFNTCSFISTVSHSGGIALLLLQGQSTVSNSFFNQTSGSSGTAISIQGDFSYHRVSVIGNVARSSVAGAITRTAEGGVPGFATVTNNQGFSAYPSATANCIVADNSGQQSLLASLADAKGDLLVASANDTITRLAVGTNGQVLTADSAEATGVKWATAAGGSGGGYATVVVAAPTGVAATDTAAIQAALTAATSTGGTVLLREGSYAINATLTIPAGVVLRGQGSGATTLLNSGLPSTSSLISSTAARVGLEDLKIDMGGGAVGIASTTPDVTMVGDFTRIVRIAFPNNRPHDNARSFVLGGAGSVMRDSELAQTTKVIRTFISLQAAMSNCKITTSGANSPGANYLTLVWVPLSGVGNFSITGCVFDTNQSENRTVRIESGSGQISGCVFMVTGVTVNTAIEAFPTGKMAITGNVAITTSAGSISAGTATVTGNIGFSSYSGGTQAGNV